MKNDLQALRRAARQGDLDALFELARRSERRDPAQALLLLTKAAERGHAGAQCRLGEACRYGLDMAAIDRRKARRWFRLAARQRHPRALAYLGRMQLEGDGSPGDFLAHEGRARVLLEAAVRLGDPLACFWLGEMREYGEGGLPIDHERAGELYAAALAGLRREARGRDAVALWHYAEAYGHAMNAGWVDIGRKKTEYSYQRTAPLRLAAANLGNAEARFELGCESRRHDRNERVLNAPRFLRAAADQGHVWAMSSLAAFLAEEHKYTDHTRGGVECVLSRDFREALHWRAAAAERGDADMAETAGDMYAAGLGARKNLRQAARFYRLAAGRGNRFAMAKLAALLERGGSGLPADAAEAARWRAQARPPVPAWAADLRGLLRRARHGDAEAQCRVGELRLNGLNAAAVNARKAAVWFRRAMQQGHARARALLGHMYEAPHLFGAVLKPGGEGTGVMLYRRAAELGDPLARLDLGLNWLYGDSGLDQDKALGAELLAAAFPALRELARQGDAEAWRRLGRMYGLGWFVSEDWDRARACFRRAAELGHAGARHDLGQLYRYGLDGCGRDGREDGDAALKWLERAADQGQAPACVRMGEALRWGNEDAGLRRDIGLAVRYCERAARAGCGEAAHDLSKMYEDGRSGRKNRRRALAWLERAAELGYDYAQRELGWKCHKGDGVPKDHARAVALLETAYLDKYPDDAWKQYRLAEEFLKEDDANRERYWESVPHDADRGLYWLRQAAVQGYADALEKLSELRLRGLHAPQDHDRAVALYEAAWWSDEGWSNERHNRNDVLDLYELGSLLLPPGYDVPADADRAAYWFARARSCALHREKLPDWRRRRARALAEMFENGHGVEQNDRKALKWSRLAGEEDFDDEEE